MKLSLIVPIYNEASIINGAIKTFTEGLSARFGSWELIFVNDGSSDGCEKAVLEAAARDPRVRLAGYAENHGKGCAVRIGMLEATGDIAIFTDCDNAYGLDAVAKIYDRLLISGADVAVGSRNLSKSGYGEYTFMRRIASKVYVGIINLVSGYRGTDSQCGLKGFRIEAAKKIFRNCKVDRWAFDLEALLLARHFGYTVTEVPVKVINHRESKIHLVRDSIRMLKDVLKMKRELKKAIAENTLE
ncbi:MAG: glycosyltransferase [Clostridia bacterium]|nr:glycosyltransferase [Clostridia bacterium]